MEIKRNQEQVIEDLKGVIENLWEQLSGTSKQKLAHIARIFRNIMLKQKGIKNGKNYILDKRIEDLLDQLPGGIEEKIDYAMKIVRDVMIEKNGDGEIVKLARKGYSKVEIAGKLEIKKSKVSDTMELYNIWSWVKIRKFINENPDVSDEEIARQANVDIETVERIRQEINLEDADIIKLSKAGYYQGEISEKLGISQSKAVSRRFRYDIFPPKKIKILIAENPKASNEEIARQANVDEETVKRLRNEVTNNRKIYDLNNVNPEDVEIIKLAKAGYDAGEIAEKLEIAEKEVCYKRKQYGVFSQRRVKGMIKENPEASDEEIARQANVDKEAVKRLREWIENRKNKNTNKANNIRGRKKTNIDKKPKRESKKELNPEPKREDEKELNPEPKRKDEKELNPEPKRKDEKELSPEPKREGEKELSPEPKREDEKKFRIELKRRQTFQEKQTPKVGVTTEEIVKRIRKELSNFPAIDSIAKRLGVPRELVTQVKEQMNKEQYDRTHTEGDFIIKRRELLIEVERNSSITNTGTVLLKHRAEVLLTEFSKFMTTKKDYSLIAYAYIKVRDYQKAIEIGEQYLGLETPSLEALKQRLQDITLEEEHEQTNVQKASLSTNQVKEPEGQEH